MNSTLIVAFLRQRFTSPMRVVLMLFMTVFPLGASILMGTVLQLGGIAAPLALILAAGAIGQDVSSGTLQLLLVRPVSRPSLLVHRWLAAVIGAMVLTVGVLALAALALTLRSMHPDALDLIRLLLEALCSAAGSAAVMIMLSTLVGGLGDVGLLVLAVIFAQMLGGIALFKHWDWLGRVSEEMRGVLMPQLSWEWMLHGAPPSWFAITSWASTVTLALAVGITRLNRRELSYAAS